MEQQLRLVIGCDPAAYDFHLDILKTMQDRGYKIDDVGCFSAHEADGGKYAEIAELVANKVVNGDYDYGILMCGTGQGMAMAANKVPGARAVLCYDVLPAVLSKNDNNGNILCTGAWNMQKKGLDFTLSMIEAWLFSGYTGTHEDGMRALERLDSLKYKK